MSTETSRLQYLLERYIRDVNSEEEHLELMRIIYDGGDAEAIRQWMDGARNSFTDSYRLEDQRANEIFKAITASGTRAIPMKKKSIGFRWWAAAAIILFLGLRTYFYFSRQPLSPVDNSRTTVHSDVSPGGNKAMLKLANGQTIVLDSARNGALAMLGNIQVIKKDSGKLIYANTGGGTDDLAVNGLNVLSTPRGGIFQITLPDGTGAWLNASSSITYPTRFTGKHREVSITGEVYFEVKQDPAHPFIVSLAANGGAGDHWLQVQVLGTHFNINDYMDAEDPRARATLLEGAVKVSVSGDSRVLRPGQQAAAALKDKHLTTRDQVDLEDVMAWKNGEIFLSHGNVQKLMRDISRWYDVDVEYRSAVPEGKYSGSVDRNVPLSSLLKALKAYGVGTRLEGKKLIVL